MSEFRLKRVQNLIREQVSGMIMRGVIKDPRINTFLSITEVKVSKDLTYADLFMSSMDGQKRLAKSVDALNHAAGFIQHKLRKTLHLRTTPVLRFKPDNGIEHGYELSKTLDHLTATEGSSDDTPQTEDGAEDDGK